MGHPGWRHWQNMHLEKRMGDQKVSFASEFRQLAIFISAKQPCCSKVSIAPGRAAPIISTLMSPHPTGRDRPQWAGGAIPCEAVHVLVPTCARGYVDDRRPDRPGFDRGARGICQMGGMGERRSRSVAGRFALGARVPSRGRHEGQHRVGLLVAYFSALELWLIRYGWADETASGRA
jgi:hypothetical protein